jgi:hypothetical protein
VVVAKSSDSRNRETDEMTSADRGAPRDASSFGANAVVGSGKANEGLIPSEATNATYAPTGYRLGFPH